MIYNTIINIINLNRYVAVDSKQHYNRFTPLTNVYQELLAIAEDTLKHIPKPSPKANPQDKILEKDTQTITLAITELKNIYEKKEIKEKLKDIIQTITDLSKRYKTYPMNKNQINEFNLIEGIISGSTTIEKTKEVGFLSLVIPNFENPANLLIWCKNYKIIPIQAFIMLVSLLALEDVKNGEEALDKLSKDTFFFYVVAIYFELEHHGFDTTSLWPFGKKTIADMKFLEAFAKHTIEKFSKFLLAKDGFYFSENQDIAELQHNKGILPSGLFVRLLLANINKKNTDYINKLSNYMFGIIQAILAGKQENHTRLTANFAALQTLFSKTKIIVNNTICDLKEINETKIAEDLKQEYVKHSKREKDFVYTNYGKTLIIGAAHNISAIKPYDQKQIEEYAEHMKGISYYEALLDVGNHPQVQKSIQDHQVQKTQKVVPHTQDKKDNTTNPPIKK